MFLFLSFAHISKTFLIEQKYLQRLVIAGLQAGVKDESCTVPFKGAQV
jgi:hypothetical protein